MTTHETPWVRRRGQRTSITPRRRGNSAAAWLRRQLGPGRLGRVAPYRRTWFSRPSFRSTFELASAPYAPGAAPAVGPGDDARCHGESGTGAVRSGCRRGCSPARESQEARSGAWLGWVAVGASPRRPGRWATVQLPWRNRRTPGGGSPSAPDPHPRIHGTASTAATPESMAVRARGKVAGALMSTSFHAPGRDTRSPARGSRPPRLR